MRTFFFNIFHGLHAKSNKRFHICKTIIELGHLTLGVLEKSLLSNSITLEAMQIKSRIYQANLKKKFQKTREKNMGIIQPIRNNFHIQNFRNQFNLKAHISHPLPSKKHTTPDLKEQNFF